VGSDVVACITTLRHIPADCRALDREAFDIYYRQPGRKCWLIRTDVEPSDRLKAYLESVPVEMYQTATCREREDWWRFAMPPPPDALLSMSFRERFPKAMSNDAGVRAVGGVYGIYNVTPNQAAAIACGFGGLDISNRVVAHSNGLRKIEIGQLNAILAERFAAMSRG
jgi:hypothetical protein